MKQRTGTFSCWLWGHKFLATDYEPRTLEVVEGYDNAKYTEVKVYTHKKHFAVDHCVRCGVKQEV